MINISDIFNIQKQSEFNDIAIQIFQHQFKNNEVYNKFVSNMNYNIQKIKDFKEIPFIPISLFKSQKIITKNYKNNVDKIFYSSGTTSSNLSKHYVTDISIYDKSIEQSFKLFYGNPSDYSILALLPSYLERNNSSLVYMVTKWMSLTKHNNNGFYLNELNNLKNKILKNEVNGIKTLLIGVSFALLDLCDSYSIPTKKTIIIETGGMKGKKEISKYTLYEKLKKCFNVNNIHSEYGMTELLSQCFSKNDGIFETPNWMKILIRDTKNPAFLLKNNKIGGINVIDLANFNSCSFIATEDIGIANNNTFKILGRLKNSDLRGCNLLLN